MLRARKVRREEPLELRLPEPILDRLDGVDPEHEVLLADSVGLALLVVLETLSPPERLAFVLHDIFAVPFDEIAPIVERSPEATRQLASRARRRIRAENTVSDPDLGAQREVVEAFLAASRDGDFDRLVAVRSDVVLRSTSVRCLSVDRGRSAGRRQSPSGSDLFAAGILTLPALISSAAIRRSGWWPFSMGASSSG
jgi:RNA polymerase sigma-70 factor (ECF subfamily)